MVERPAKGMIIMLALPYKKRVKILDTTPCIVVQPDLQLWDNSMSYAEYCTALQAINHHHLFGAFLKPYSNCWIFEPDEQEQLELNRIVFVFWLPHVWLHLMSNWTRRVADDVPTSAHERAIDLIGILLLGFFQNVSWSLIDDQSSWYLFYQWGNTTEGRLTLIMILIGFDIFGNLNCKHKRQMEVLKWNSRQIIF